MKSYFQDPSTTTTSTSAPVSTSTEPSILMSFLGDLMPYFQRADEQLDSDGSATVTEIHDDQGLEHATRVRVPRVRVKKERGEEIGSELDHETEVVRSKKIPLQIRRFGLPDDRVRWVS